MRAPRSLLAKLETMCDVRHVHVNGESVRIKPQTWLGWVTLAQGPVIIPQRDECGTGSIVCHDIIVDMIRNVMRRDLTSQITERFASTRPNDLTDFKI